MGTTARSDRLTTVTLPAEDQILITRSFDAPPELVYRAWTTPELVTRWWHANRGRVTRAEIDLRPGGRWRWVMATPDGREVGFHGEYREIVPNERIVSTEVYEGLPPGVTEEQAATVNTATFTLDGGGTSLTLLIQATSVIARDAIIDSGMEHGLQDAMNLLEEVARALRADGGAD